MTQGVRNIAVRNIRVSKTDTTQSYFHLLENLFSWTVLSKSPENCFFFFTLALQPKASKLYQNWQTIFRSIRKWNFLVWKFRSDVTILFRARCSAPRSIICRQLELKWISENISSTLWEILRESWTCREHKFAFSLVASSSLQTIYLINKWNSLFSKTRDGKVLRLFEAVVDFDFLLTMRFVLRTFTNSCIASCVGKMKRKIFIRTTTAWST